MIRFFTTIASLLFSANVMAMSADIRLHINGQSSLSARLDSLKNSSHLYIESFYFENDRVGRLILKKLLEEKTDRPAFSVRILVDAWGSDALTPTMLCTLKSKGIEIKLFNSNGGIFNQQRTHRKIWVTDKHAFIGGRNISNENLSENGEELSDWDVEINGDASNAINSSFLQAWTSRLSTVPDCSSASLNQNWLEQINAEEEWSLPTIMPQWSPAEISWHTDEVGNNSIRPVSNETARLLRGANRSIEIENAYFLPVGAISDELGNAKSRGLKIEYYLNGPKTDMWMALYSTCLPLNEIQWWIEAGARVAFTQKEKRTHAKSLFIDNQVLAIGSFNFDSRSINTNAETLLVIRNSPDIFEQYRAEHTRRMNEGYNVSSVKEIFEKYNLSERQSQDCMEISILKPFLKYFF